MDYDYEPGISASDVLTREEIQHMEAQAHRASCTDPFCRCNEDDGDDGDDEDDEDEDDDLEDE